MHIHNAPMDDPDHPKSAVKTGLFMFTEWRNLMKKSFLKVALLSVWVPVLILVLVTLARWEVKRHSYDVLGDAVSTAARIESKCKEYNCNSYSSVSQHMTRQRMTSFISR